MPLPDPSAVLSTRDHLLSKFIGLELANFKLKPLKPFPLFRIHNKINIFPLSFICKVPLKKKNQVYLLTDDEAFSGSHVHMWILVSTHVCFS